MPDDSTSLPGILLESADPVERNPFPPDDLRHSAWKNATAKAEQTLHRFNSRVLEFAPQMALRGVRGYHAMMLDLVSGKFDIWSERGVSVVWDEEAIGPFERWMFGFAESWLESVKSDAEKRERETGINWEVETLLAELKVRLVQRLEYWRSEARRYAALQTAHFAVQAASHKESRPGATQSLATIQVSPEPVVAKATLGQNINRLRKECGWTFDELAEVSGIDKKTILRHVNDGTKAYPSTLKAYATAFTTGLGRPVTVAELENRSPE